MKLKKVIAGLTAAIMAVSLCACGEKKGGDAFKIENGKFVALNDLPLTVWYTQGTDYAGGNEIENNVVQNYVYDKTKVKFETTYGNDGGQWDTKLSRLLTGDNMPDVVICGGGQGPTHYAKLAKAKQLWEITDDMLEKYAPNVLKRIPKEMIDAFRINGKIYGLPYAIYTNDEQTQPNASAEEIKYINDMEGQIAVDETMGLFVRDDILKKVYPQAKTWKEIEELAAKENGPIGDEIFDTGINTTQDYIDFMYKIKDMNLSENGKQVYAFGYSGGDNWEAITYLGGDMMGYAPNYYIGAWNQKDNCENILLDDEIVKEAAKIQNKMIRDGVIDPESLMHTSQMFTEKVDGGQYAICAVSYAGGLNLVNSQLEKSGKPYRYRPLYVNIPNKPEYAAGTTKSSWKYAIAFTKELSEDQLIQALNWMNVCFSDEFEEVYYWGTKEDGLYTENADGTRTYTDERFTKRYLEGDSAALDWKDSKGISGNSGAVGVWYPVATANSRWEPGIYNKCFKMSADKAAQRFKEDSDHIVKTIVPPYLPWDPTFAECDKTVEFWAKREQWENPVKLAFAAKSDEEFETKWTDALNKLNEIVNIEEMCNEMTDLAKKAE